MGGLLGTVLPLVGGALFGPIGFIAGSLIAGLFSKDVVQKGNQVSEFSVSNSEAGSDIPAVKGRIRIGGNIIWHSGFDEHSKKKKVADGGKGGSDQYVKEYYYSNKVAFAIARNELAGFRRIWFDNKLVYSYNGKEYDDFDEYGKYFSDTTISDNFSDNILYSKSDGGKNWSVEFYTGSENQKKNPEIEKKEGELTPNFKGLAYMFFSFSNLTEWGHRIPKIEVEVIEKGFNSDLKVIDQNDNIEILSNVTENYNYPYSNVLDLLEVEISTQEEIYAYTNEAELSLKSHASSKKDVYTYNYLYNNVRNNDATINDNRLYLSPQGFKLFNGNKEVIVNKNAPIAINKNYDFITSSSPTSRETKLYTIIENKSFTYLNRFGYGINLDYFNKIKTGARAGSVICANNNYEVFMLFNNYDYFNGKNANPESVFNNQILIKTNNKDIFISDINNEKVYSFFNYSSNIPIVLTSANLDSNNQFDKINAYALSIYFDSQKGYYTYNAQKVANFNLSGKTSLLTSVGQKSFAIKKAISGSVTFSESSFPVGRSAYSKKTMLDPRFNLLIETNSQGDHIQINVYKILSSGEISLIKNRNINVENEVIDYVINFNQSLNLICICRSDNGNFYTREINVSYLKDKNVTNDFKNYLDEVVEELLIQSSYSKDEIDVSELKGIEVLGYVYANGDTARSHIDKLRTAYQFDIVEEDFIIKAKKRGLSVRREFTDKDIGFYNQNNYENSVAYNLSIASSVELPTVLSLKYASLNIGYKDSVQKSEYISEHTKDQVLELPIATTDNEAKRITDIVLTSIHREVYTYTFNVGLNNIDLNVSDIIKLNDIVLRINSVNVNDENIEIEAVSDSANSYKSNAIGTKSSTGFQQDTNKAPVVAELVMFNAPALTKELFDINKPCIYAFALSENDIDDALFFDADSPELVNKDTPQQFLSTNYGVLTNNNEANSIYGFDDSVLYVDVKNGSVFESVDKSELFDSKYLNLMAIINGENVEFVQFKDVSLNNGIYEFTGLLRQRFNSMYVKSFRGSKIIFLDEDTLYTRVFNLDRINTTQFAKLTSGYIDLSGADLDSLNINGENIRPPEVVNLEFDNMENNGIITYTPVANFGEWKNNKDVDYSYIEFKITLYDINNNVLKQDIISDIKYEYSTIEYNNVKYINIIAINKNNGLESKPKVLEI